MKPRNVQRIEDELLVLEAQAGDVHALSLLCERWDPRLRRHAWHLTGEREATREVVQEAWLAIVRGLSRLEDSARFAPWAYRITTHKAADWIRRRQRRPTATPELAELPAASTTEPGTDDALLNQLRAGEQVLILTPEDVAAAV